jgi:hypothetical protein
MYHPDDLAAMDPLVLMKNLDHVRMTSRLYVEAERQIEGEMARRRIRA